MKYTAAVASEVRLLRLDDIEDLIKLPQKSESALDAFKTLIIPRKLWHTVQCSLPIGWIVQPFLRQMPSSERVTMAIARVMRLRQIQDQQVPGICH